ncbi:hypothetical protein BJF92_12630 [Rhizobium rhizosphaerae]|uniref:Uncharacterized protein n=1 Tax=Xaviernesmea rhizosphaerae TaxID=1672749 RepID=A0A1Q9AJV0_9HYPH|nr:DUF6665 family protein [Xaviernesmea rhizosphaerae]OLP55517.1 hypothetical protein BJF92_12630 [Xaviernesmea rhizosphaerae]
MSFRPPQSLSSPGSRQTPLNALEYEIMAERADALGRCGLKVEAALAALSAFDAGVGDAEGGEGPAREALVDAAADVTWAFFIQRELCGFRSNRDVIERYRIPGEVIARVGVVRRPKV